MIGEIYKIPNPLRSEEDWIKWTHRDLAALSRAELERERARLRMRLILEDRPHHWLLERLEVIEEALR
ncbi:MAG TPA: hypothetical protein VLY20_12530 [Nitrospiria bacterium]|nr:hypothetical protein [Nitrospiria bacterium]